MSENSQAPGSVNLPPVDPGNRYVFSGLPVDITCEFVPIQGRLVYVITFRQGGTTFSLPVTDAQMLNGLGMKFIEDSNKMTRPSGLYVPNGTPVKVRDNPQA